ncbi:ankyrin repeat domain-containing protein [Wolbachia pipientis]|uniref:ankyrin repeat domain-containing protein n=1 Tax=Wolbachia pipientis TaxID=955 RepID=UPI0035C93347
MPGEQPPIINSKDEDGKTPLHIALEQPSPNSDIINYLLSGNLDIKYTSVQGSNYLHLAAKARNVDAFLSTFKQSVKSNVHLLEYNEDHENPFHIAARMGILLDVVKGIFKYLESDKTNPGCDSEKLENYKSYIQEALCNRCALDKSKKTPLDWVSKTVKKKIRETAGIQDSFICNQKFRLCLYIVGAIACIAALCLSLYFLFLVSQSLALATMAGIVSGGAAYLSGKVFSEIHDLHDVSTLEETFSGTDLARVTV